MPSFSEQLFLYEVFRKAVSCRPSTDLQSCNPTVTPGLEGALNSLTKDIAAGSARLSGCADVLAHAEAWR